MTRVALYRRVSSEEQAKEGFSLAAQTERLRHYVMAQGWTIAGEYADEGKSARDTKRPGYLQMMADMADWDTILALKMDRIHRNSKNFLTMLETLEENGKGFASVMESLDTRTAMGRFVTGIICGIAQLESETIGERTTVGMLQKAKEGAGGLGGPAPYGYRWQDGKLVMVPEEARLVRSMFLLRDSGCSPGEIADGAHISDTLTRQGKPWTYWSVKAILDNEVTYQGTLTWNGIVQHGAHEALIPLVREGRRT